MNDSEMEDFLRMVEQSTDPRPLIDPNEAREWIGTASPYEYFKAREEKK